MEIPEKVRQALERYADGGTLSEHLGVLYLRHRDFYAYLRTHADEEQLLDDIEKARARMMVDESYGIALEPGADSRAARVKADIRLKIAAMYDRRRFGDRLDVAVTSVDITGALTEARGRALRPMSDLALVEDAQVIEHATRLPAPRTDTQSVPAIKPPAVDIFADE